MNRFIAISQAPEVLDAVPAKFPDHHFEIQHGVWAVAATNKTAGDICDALGINRDGKHAGVVINASAYNGYFSNNLWEKLQLWEEL